MLRRINIPSGIVRESTQLSAGNSWYDSNNIRFRNNKAEVIGGWDDSGTYELEGFGRSTFSSKDFDNNNYQWVGTDWKWYIIVGDVSVDITPTRASRTNINSASNPFTVTGDSSIVTVTDPDNGAGVNDFVRFDEAAGTAIASDVWNSVGGYRIFDVIDGDSYRIDVGVKAIGSGSSTEGGASVDAYYKVRSGVSTQVIGQGFGAGTWGGDTYLPTKFLLKDANPLWTDVSTTLFGFQTPNTTDWPQNVTSNPDYVYFVALSGTVNGIDLAILNEKWFPVSSLDSAGRSGTPEILMTLSSAGVRLGIKTPLSGSDLDNQSVGASVDIKMYQALAANGLKTTGATRGWNDSSAETTIVMTTRRTYIDNYGEDVMFCNSGGPIYYYDVSKHTSGGVPGESYTDVGEALSTFTGSESTPTLVNSFLISKKDGHAVALGCEDLGDDRVNNMLVRWSDQNNPFDWLPTPINTSGGQVLRVGSTIIGGIGTKDEVVIFTDAAVYSMRFTGAPNTFSFNLITAGVEIVSDRTAVNAANTVFFMGNDGFYTYTGTVNPLDCPVTSYVFDEFNFDQKEKAFAAVNSAFSEIMWFYPSSVHDDATNTRIDSYEPDRYVAYNYEDNVWTIGSMDMLSLKETADQPGDPTTGTDDTTTLNRTSWRDSIVFQNPTSSYISSYSQNGLSFDGTTRIGLVKKTKVMKHETGTSANGSDLNAHLESGEVEISDGERFSLFSRLIPDIQLFNHSDTDTSPIVTVEVNGRDFPGEDSSQKTSSTVTFSTSAGTYTPTGNATAIRGRGRSMSIKISSSSTGYQWRMGAFRFEIRPDGRR